MEQAERPEVKQYWERVADEFDSIYSKRSLLDRVFRKDMYQRYELTLEECRAPEVRTVLDVGTGSGRFCHPLAAEKDRVTGIDYSAPMIELAKKRAAELGVADRCEFLVGDFLATEFEEPFDAVIAIGLFDYIERPEVFLRAMRKLTRVKLVTTWPTVFTWRMPVRWLRLKLKGCPVYFFTPGQIRRLHEAAGLAIDRLERVGKIYFVVARAAAARDA